jgi:hypothetical protein
MELIAQILGLVGVLFTVLTYQMNTNQKVLLTQGASAVCFFLNYLLLGAYPGAALNLVAVARNYTFGHRDKKFLSGYHVPILFALAMALCGALTWQGPASLLVIVALILNTLALGTGKPMLLRWSILITSPMVLAYNCIVFSLGGILNESLAIASAIVGIVRYRRA